MRITNGQIGMESGRSYTSGYTYSMGIGAGSTLGMFGRVLFSAALTDGNSDDSSQAAGTARKIISTGGDLNDIASQFRALSNTTKVTAGNKEDTMDTLEKIRQEIMEYLMKLLFSPGETAKLPSDNMADTGGDRTGSYDGSGGFISLTQGYEETEETEFSTSGKVQTSDGREIDFDVNLKMSRSFSEYYSSTIGYVPSMCDPLVINMDTGMTEISEQKFLFDLDCDGDKEEISEPGSGSGFLALDSNNNGKIDNGSELFGTKSGDGFADLKKYDSDGNGWIDENDPVWDRLQIWTKDSEGKDLLYKLSDKGIGAICLKNVSTDFTQRGMSDGLINGEVKRTGIFLYENGSVGTVQHIDLALQA